MPVLLCAGYLACAVADHPLVTIPGETDLEMLLSSLAPALLPRLRVLSPVGVGWCGRKRMILILVLEVRNGKRKTLAT